MGELRRILQVLRGLRPSGHLRTHRRYQRGFRRRSSRGSRLARWCRRGGSILQRSTTTLQAAAPCRTLTRRTSSTGPSSPSPSSVIATLSLGPPSSFPKEAGHNIEASTPVLVHSCLRGNGTVLKGYSANSITHAIRPCDLPSRRSSIILRRILPTAPVLVHGKTIPLKAHLAGQQKS